MNEDKEVLNEVSESQLLVEIASVLKEVDILLGKKLKPQALSVALQSSSIGNKLEAIKDANAAIIEKVLLALSEADIIPSIEHLNLDSCDVLMKYVYKFMGKSQNCALMLKLHAQLCEKGGTGSIMRVLTDRKQI